jgi:hypothetical protein
MTERHQRARQEVLYRTRVDTEYTLREDRGESCDRNVLRANAVEIF